MKSDIQWSEVFDREFSNLGQGVMDRVWREVYGDEYPERAEPYSYVSTSELERLAKDLSVGPGKTLADLGCGRGGPGLWVAERTGANLVGSTSQRSH